MNYTATDIHNVLTLVAEDFLVDVPAVHTEEGYFLEIGAIEKKFTDIDAEWLEDIAGTLNTKLGLGGE